MMFKRVLVPLDGSETAERVLPQLRRLLHDGDAEIVLLRALDPAAPEVVIRGTKLEDEAERYLRRIGFELTQEGRRTRGLVRSGGASSSILRVAREEEVDLIALSTHGRSGLTRLVFGSVAESVLRGAEVPVFLARTFPGGPSRGTIEARPLRNVLIPLDGGEVSRRVVPLVRDLVRPLDARVTLVYVNEPPGPHSHWVVPDAALEDVEHTLRAATIPVTAVVRDGDPAAEILAACRSNDVDLLVMATHARSGPARWVLGSVAETVLRSSEVPMIAVPVRRANGRQEGVL